MEGVLLRLVRLCRLDGIFCIGLTLRNRRLAQDILHKFLNSPFGCSKPFFLKF
jgi:hypothetical protein